MNIFQDYLREKFLESYSVFKMCKLTTLLCMSICAGGFLVFSWRSNYKYAYKYKYILMI
jgi:hypothetical protein